MLNQVPIAAEEIDDIIMTYVDVLTRSPPRP